MATELALCCAPACPLMVDCHRNEMHHERRGIQQHAVRLDGQGNYACSHFIAFPSFSASPERPEDD